MPWIQGMRDYEASNPKVPPTPSTDPSPMAWQEIVFRRLTGRLDGISQGKGTRFAERVLELDEPQVYYGVGRNSPDFGDFVIVFDPIRDDATGGQVAPFDTGGLASGNSRVRAPLSFHEMAVIVRATSLSASTHQRELRQWIRRAFVRGRDYFASDKTMIPSENRVPEIIVEPGVDQRRWAWEARLPARDTALGVLRPRRLYFRDDYRARYQRWVDQDNRMDLATAKQHMRMIARSGRSVDRPYDVMSTLR